jgi:uncharacterized protein with GYD domain
MSKEADMNTYIIFVRYTQQGATHIRQSPTRLDSTRKMFESSGARINEWYLTFGQYDAMMVADAPNDETIARLTLTLCSQGNVRTETVRALREDEYRQVIESLP